MAVDKNYASLPLFKSWRTAGERNDRDDLMAVAIGAASRAIDAYTGRRFWLDEVASARTFNARDNVVVDGDGARLLVDDIGDLTGLLVETGSGASWSDVTAGVEVWPLNAAADGLAVEGLLYGSGWPVGSGSRVRITARWGWPVVPDEVRQACLILAARLYARRNTPEGVLGQAEWGVVRVGRADPDVVELLLPYRRVVVG